MSSSSKNTSAEMKLEALRVAQGELCSGNMSGSVYMQLSPGAAAFLTDRTVAMESVSKGIRATIEADDLRGIRK
eukprot:CAMPEP_0119013410 /NCGR_PEP_ID=MMETSP1176-20130426/8438_1 /TAXON_ID=265551 /ORGANISM="Synedropsis recta cf, Strain CCMP1620" /LENGTH=73 /DNA_ID=CAMNT_0006966501 /DNA_START=67 /DNA_END=288 /DNA_ORIENTATION=-